MGLTPATQTAEYLLVGLGTQTMIGTSTAVSNFELGANTSVVPMSGLAGSVPWPLPPGAQTVLVGIGGNGDIPDTSNFFLEYRPLSNDLIAIQHDMNQHLKF